MSKLTPTELVTYIMSMSDDEMEAYSQTLRAAITLGADEDLCNIGIKAILREAWMRSENSSRSV